MKSRPFSAFAMLWMSAIGTASAGAAQMDLFTDQIRMSPGPCSCGFGLVWNVHFSTFYTEYPETADGGFVRQPAGSARTHRAYMLLEDPSMFTSVSPIEADLPMGDSNNNGVPDLFEDGPEIFASTTGTYNNDWGPGTLSFTWHRPQGTAVGTCDLYMDDPILGRLGPFKHTFEARRFSGALSYQAGPSARVGTINLSFSPENTITGAVQFVRAAADPAKNLILKAGTWKMGTTDLAYSDTPLTRDPARSTHYHGALQLGTTYAICIVDAADANANGIPDLSDDVPPQLSIRRGVSLPELVIQGEAGHSYEVQTSSSLNPLSWAPFSTVVLTVDQQAVQLTPPATGSKFWRIKAQ